MELLNKTSTLDFVDKRLKYVKQHKVLSTLILYNILLIVCAISIDNFILHNYPDYRKLYEFNFFPKLSSVFQTHKNNFLSLISNVEKKNILIDLQTENLLKLKKKRNDALEKGALFTSVDDYVPAQIRYRDKITKVKLRLKEDWTDHLSSEKWSFRVIVSGDKTLMGMKKFSLQHPKTKNYLYEWVYQQALIKEGLLGLRYDFVDLNVN